MSRGVPAGEAGPEPFAKLIKTEAAKWRAVVSTTGVRLD
jgi:hypothetical protein